MSVLIKGMEMPPIGTGKVIMIDSDGDVWTAGKDECTIITGAKAIPVPPHGRLIDADALLSQYKENIWTAQTDYAEGLRDVAKDIVDAPTIIPAEKEV